MLPGTEGGKRPFVHTIPVILYEIRSFLFFGFIFFLIPEVCHLFFEAKTNDTKCMYDR